MGTLPIWLGTGTSQLYHSLYSSITISGPDLLQRTTCIIVCTMSGIVPPSGFHVLPPVQVSCIIVCTVSGIVQPSCSTYPILCSKCTNYDTAITCGALQQIGCRCRNRTDNQIRVVNLLTPTAQGIPRYVRGKPAVFFRVRMRVRMGGRGRGGLARHR